MNPFLVLGCADARTPLNPGVHGSHEDYADVDHTKEQFEVFKNEFGTGEGVLRTGRLVVASGPAGSGKTSLVNRCVKHFLAKARECGRHPMVIDLRRDRLDRGETAERMRLLSERLVDELTVHDMINADGATAQRSTDPDRMFPLLSKELGENTIVAVLLPPSGDLIAELIEYARFARGKLMFFAETSFYRRLRDQRAEFHSAGGTAPLFLELGPLNETDGDLFLVHRLTRHRDEGGGWPDGAEPPNPATGKLEKLVSERPMSIGELQLLLHEIYDLLLTEVPQPELSDELFLRAVLRLSAPGSGES
ncbi:hypothetical protein O7635_07655 [Asanoa sp. WMMD1127]|uniref:hypothetical protein n=1 Tax=Asanoa sp. WMMD1127 TaxID=3016107 RepID=UPI002417A97D|nr:hypothetical protein [Asanoa sp. WMMD1127]MDG4821727.1 hypothetical protein [Asanoa sp. WMMD1127]